MRKAVVLLLLIATMDMIANGILLDSDGYQHKGSDESDDTFDEEEEIDKEDGNSVGSESEGEAVDGESESLDRTPDKEWLNSAVQDIAYYLRAHKFNDFDRRYHENENMAPRVSKRFI
jgi:hypothetical protein